MTKLSIRRLVLLLGGLALLPLVAAHAQAPLPGGQRPDAEVRAYWTFDRIARAIPRDYVVNARGQIERGTAPAPEPGPPGPPHGGGGGGDGSSSGTGSSWTGDQSVAWATGRVYFTMGGTDYTCSGTIVSENDPGRAVVLSAGHCVYDEVNNAFGTNWMFIPNYDLRDAFFISEGGCAAYPGRCWVGDALVAPQRWADGTADTVNFGSDFGFAVFTDSVEIDGFDAHPYAYPLTSPYPAAPTVIDAFGYPAAQKYKGTDLVYCEGPTIQDPYAKETNWGIACDMTGGASGGGWLADFTGSPHLGSVNSYRYQGGPYRSYLFGPLFTAETTATYQAALAAESNHVVSYP